MIENPEYNNSMLEQNSIVKLLRIRIIKFHRVYPPVEKEKLDNSHKIYHSIIIFIFYI